MANVSVVVLANSLTLADMDPKTTSTLFADSAMSEPSLIAADPAAAMGSVNDIVNFWPTADRLVPMFCIFVPTSAICVAKPEKFCALLRL